MTWFKVDDGFSTHRKVDALGRDQAVAVAAWTLCGSACARDLADGFVSHAALLRALASWPAPDRARASAALCRVGLWHPVDGGFQFHSWADFQPSRADVEAERAAGKERQRRSRARRATVTDAVSHEPVTRDKTVSHSDPTRPDPTRPEGESESPPTPETGPIPLPGHTGAPWRPLVEPIRNAILDWAQNRRVAAPKEAAVGNEGAAIVPIAKWLWETGELQGWTPGERIDRCRWLVRERFYATKDARTQAKGYPLAWLAANPAEYALDSKRGAA